MVCGPTRNLTSIYNKARHDHKNKRNRFGSSILGGGSLDEKKEGQQRLLGSEGTHGEAHASSAAEVEMSSLPPVWVDLVEEAQEDLNKIKEKLTALQKAQQKRLLKVFGDDLNYTDAEVDNLTDQVTALLRKCEGKVVQIKTRGATDLTEKEVRMRENAQRSVAVALSAMHQQYKQQQKQYMSELEKRQGGPDIFTRKAAESLNDDDLFSSDQVQELEDWEQKVDQRSAEISKIARSMADLQGIFKELAVLVIDQGTILDRIDYNIETVVTQVREANKHIEKAESYQKSARATQCAAGLAIAIFVLVILLIIKHSVRRRYLLLDISDAHTHTLTHLSDTHTDTDTHTLDKATEHTARQLMHVVGTVVANVGLF